MQLAKKLIIGGSCLSGFCIIMKWFLFEEILKIGIKDQTSLSKGNEIRGIYLKLPFPLDFKIYFFNVTNPTEVQNGSKPILNEIGPFCYDEFVEKIDVVENDAEDSLTYTGYSVFQFNATKSGSLSDEEYVTIINPLLVGMVNQVTRESPALLSIVNQAITEIFNNPESIYLTAKVKDILFDGIPINCKVQKFPAKAVCSQLKQQIPGLKIKEDPQVYYFSLLGSRNATAGSKFKVERGISNSANTGRVLEVGGEKQLKIWSTSDCNEFKGTDGWIFAPMMASEEGLKTFSTDLCRNIKAEFIEDIEYKGLHLRKYEADLGNMQEDEDLKCYCPTPETCLKKGVFDLSKCMGVPIYASLPHFLKTDESYLEQVEGMHPDPEKHLIRIKFEPMTASPLEAKKRMQLNLPIEPNPKITLMQNLPEALHPIFWLEEGIELEGPLLKKIQTIFKLLKIFGITLWISIFSGLGIIGLGAYYHYKNNKGVEITPVHEISTISKSFASGNMIENDSKKCYVNHAMSGHEFDKFSK